MQAQFSKLTELNKTTVDSVQKVTVIHKNLWVNLTQQQLDVFNIYLESSVKQLHGLSQTKNIKDVFVTQADFVQELTKKLLNNVRVSLEIVSDAKTQLNDLVEKNAALFTSNLNEFASNPSFALVPATPVNNAVVPVTEAVVVSTPAKSSRSKKSVASE